MPATELGSVYLSIDATKLLGLIDVVLVLLLTEPSTFVKHTIQ